MISIRTLGGDNEYEIIAALNGKQIKDIPEHFREPIKKMIYHLKDHHEIQAKNVSTRFGCKTDFEIHAHGIICNISVKCGHFPSLHQEEFGSFIDFLRDIGVSERTIKIVKFYHYADGSLDGTGTLKLRFDLFRERYQKYIDEASKELSQERIVRAIVYRGIIKGRKPTRQEIDYLYYGTKNEGIFFHKSELLDNVYKYGYPKYTALHFGPIVYVAKIPSRKNSAGQIMHYAQLRWPNIKEDLYKMYCDIHNLDYYFYKQ